MKIHSVLTVHFISKEKFFEQKLPWGILRCSTEREEEH
jgi:hypothetical protein